MSQLKEYVDQMLSGFNNKNIKAYYKWFRQNAVLYTEIDKVLSEKLAKRSKIKRCFDNCSKLALRNKKLEYVEGFVHSLIPLEHAFLIYNGKVVDPTLAIKTGFDERYGIEYYGIIIPKNILFKLKQNKNKYLPMPYLYWEYLQKTKEILKVSNIVRLET